MCAILSGFTDNYVATSTLEQLQYRKDDFRTITMYKIVNNL